MRFVFLIITTLGLGLTLKAQTGIGTFTPDPDKALHIVARPGQQPIRLEGLNEGTAEGRVVVTDNAGVLRYRNIGDLTVSGEWTDHTSGTYIYAARAQASGNNVVVTDSGNLGIGTTTPATKLHVDGAIRIQDGNELQFRNENVRLFSPGNNQLDFRLQDRSFFRRESDGTVAVTVDHDEQRLGVNLGTPSTTLDVNGQTRLRVLPIGVASGDPAFDDDLVTTDGAGNLRKVSMRNFYEEVGEWRNHTTDNFIYARRAKEDGANQWVSISRDGKLGMGVPDALEKIHLRDGGIRVDGYDFGIGFNGANPYDAVSNTDGSRLYPDRNFFGSNRDALVIEKTDFNNNSIDGGIAFTNRERTNTRTVNMVIRGNGRVGIGTTNPLARLEVHGSLLVRDNGTNASDASTGLIEVVDQIGGRPWSDRGIKVADAGEYAYFGLASRPGNANENGVVLWGSGTDQDFQFIHANGAIEATVMHLDGNSQNIGIGTTAPQQRLHVEGRAQISQLDNGVVNGSAADDRIVTANASGVLRAINASDLFQDFEDNDWTIDGNDIYNSNSANVGIGTNDPLVKLDVNDDVRIRDEHRLMFRNDRSFIFSPNDNDISFDVNGETRFLRNGGGSHPLVIEHGTGNVGIGVNDPNSRLEVDGNQRMVNQSEIRFGGNTRNSIYAQSDNDLRVTANQRFSVRNGTDNREVVTVMANQTRMGVNETTPQRTLDVGGRVRIQDLPTGDEDDFFITATAAGDLEKVELSQFEGPWDNVVGTPGRIFPKSLTDRVGIGINNPRSALHIFEPTGTPANREDGSITLEHGNSGGSSSIVFKSRANNNNDYGYINYSDDGSIPGGNSENSLLEIGTENDGFGNNVDNVAIMPSGGLGIGIRNPQALLHVDGSTILGGLTTSTTRPWVVTADNAGLLTRQSVDDFKDNLGNHIAEDNLEMGNFTISHDGSAAGIRMTDENSTMLSNRLQIGNLSPNWVDDVITGITGNGFAGNDGAVFAPVRTGTESSDLRLYILDNPNDAFSIWGNPCGTADCGEINNSSRVIRFQADGQIFIDKLAHGTGTAQMVLANGDGSLVLGGTVPTSGGAGTTPDNLGNHIAEQHIRLNDFALTNDGGGNDGFRINDNGDLLFSNNRAMFWSSNIYGTSISGNVQANGEGGLNDLRFEARDDIYMQSRGGGGDIILRPQGDFDVDANQESRIRTDNGQRFYTGTDNNNDDFRFFTNDNTERVVFENEGRVKINNLGQAGNTSPRIVTADEFGRLSTMVGSSTGLWERDGINGEVTLVENSDEVGIGTDNPESNLHIQGTRTDAQGPVEIQLANMDGNGPTALWFKEGTNADAGMRLKYDGGDNKLYLEQGNTDKYMTFERGQGSVGIGTTNPAAQFHVVRQVSTESYGAGAGLNNPARIRIQNNSGEGSSALEFAEGSGNLGDNSGMSLRYHSSADGSRNAFEIMRGDAEDANPARVHFSVERNSGRVAVRTLESGGGNKMVISNAAGELFTQDFEASLWDRDATNSETYLANNGDKVGIGTTAPTSVLHVDGDVRVGSFGTGNATDFVVTTNALGVLRKRPASDFENFWERDASNNFLFTKTTADAIGIGTSAPAAKLDVNGNLRVQTLVAGAAGVDAFVVADADGVLKQVPASVLENYWERVTGASDYIELSNGTDLVGIGTIGTPAATLHVNGSVRINFLANPTDGEVVMANAQGDLYTQPLAAELWERTGTTTTLRNAGDDVGIGTGTPITKLDVEGDARIATMVTGTSTDDIVVRAPDGVLKKIAASTIESHWTREALTNEIYPKNIGDKVGIGTTDPRSPLHLRWAGGTGLVDPVEVKIVNTTNRGTAQIRFRDGNNPGAISELYNSMLLRYNGTSDGMEIANGSDSIFVHVRRRNGFMALGYPYFVPEERLHVDGNMKVGNGHMYRFNEPNSYLRDLSSTGGGDDDVMLRAQDILYLRAGDNRGLRINEDGTVRFENMGTTTNQGFDMVVSNTAGDVRRISASDYASNFAGPWLESGGDVRLPNSAFNVGIGVTPSAGNKLDVNGTTRIRTLSGTGERMVVASDVGVLSTRALPQNNWQRIGTAVTLATAGDLVGIGGGTAAGQVLTVTGSTQITTLGGGGSARMVVADNNGTLTTQAIPITAGPWTRNSGTGRVALATNSDNVGIGTATAVEKLTVDGNLRLVNSSRLQIGTASNAIFNTTTNDLAINSATGRVVVGSNQVRIGNAATTTTTAIFDNTNRRLGVGDITTPTATVHIRSATPLTTPALVIESLRNAPGITGSTGSPFRRLLINEATGEVVRSTGVYTEAGRPGPKPSDSRLKTVVAPLDKVLTLLDGISAIEYKYTSDAATSQQLGLDANSHYGVIAQEVQAAFPHAVTELNGYYHVDYEELVGVLLGATKELMAQNDSLSDRLDEAAAERAELKADMARVLETLKK